MLKSMTGYGFYQETDEYCSQSWEIKSVNSKQFNLRWNLPSSLLFQELNWEKFVRNFAERGRIEISLRVDIFNRNVRMLSLNKSLVQGMLGELRELAEENEHEFWPDYSKFLSMSGIWQENKLTDWKELVQNLEKGLFLALEDWNHSREQEGRELCKDLLFRIRALKKVFWQMQESTKDLSKKKFALLKSRIGEFLETELIQQDKERMLQEFALLADRLDVSEERVRLQTHLNALEHFLNTDGANGRKLDFLLQECFREVNTCSNKAQDADVSSLTVEMKSELEKCREQVQNLE